MQVQVESKTVATKYNFIYNLQGKSEIVQNGKMHKNIVHKNLSFNKFAVGDSGSVDTQRGPGEGEVLWSPGVGLEVKFLERRAFYADVLMVWLLLSE